MLYHKRLQKEKKENQKGTKEFYIQPVDDNYKKWHFTLRGQKGSPYEGGLYHGFFQLPHDYPMAPPDIYFLNHSGRYKTNTKICMTITSHHKSDWTPAWSLRTMMSAIGGYFIVEDKGIGSIKASEKERKQFA